MSILKTIIFLFIVNIAFNYHALAEKSEEPKNIVILFSFSSGLPAYNEGLEEIKNTLRTQYTKPYNLFLEYLQVERFPDENYQKYFFGHYNNKYRNMKIDLLIAIGPNINPLIKKYGEKFFLEAPTICLDFYNPALSEQSIALNSTSTEILLVYDVKKSLETALSLFPGTNSIYIISGMSIIDNYFKNLTIIASKEIDKNLKFIPISDLSMEEIIEFVKKLSDSSIIFLPNFFTDRKNTPYYTTDCVKLISQVSRVPIFTLVDTQVGEGAIGGYVICYRDAGAAIGNSAVSILNGESPQSIKINSKSFYKYIFDWRELKKWNLLDTIPIPAGSMILFRETDFIGQYMWYIAAGFSFLILQMLIIVNLFRMNKKQKTATAKLIEMENQYRELIREDRLLRMSELTASLAHELNQPLTAIRSGALAGIRFIDSKKSNTQLIKKIFHTIVEDDKRAASIISSVRAMMKLEQRDKDNIELNFLVGNVVAIFKGESVKQNIKLRKKLTDESTFVFGDPIQLQQVILNFIFNAAISMESTEVKNKIIALNLDLDNGSVILSVRDFGTGIDESIKDELFKPFITNRIKGFGIGLAVSKSIIEDHGGRVWAENMPDGGAKFSFSLKIIKDE
jgi:signal transduction histidine kinase